MNYTWCVVKCQICKKEFLVERLLIGTEHTSSIFVSCKECLKKKGLYPRFVKEYPEEAKKIQKWLESKKIE